MFYGLYGLPLSRAPSQRKILLICILFFRLPRQNDALKPLLWLIIVMSFPNLACSYPVYHVLQHEVVIVAGDSFRFCVGRSLGIRGCGGILGQCIL